MSSEPGQGGYQPKNPTPLEAEELVPPTAGMATRSEPLYPDVRVTCTDLLEHQLKGLRPDDITSGRVFRFSCDVELCGYARSHVVSPLGIDLEFVSIGTPTIEEIPAKP